MTNIYFLLNEQNKTVKIGRSQDPTERLRALQTANSVQLKFVYVIPNMEETFEAFVQEVCSRFHVEGEWFEARVIEDHLLRHPWYSQHMIKYSDFLKTQEKKNDKSSSNSSGFEFGNLGRDEKRNSGTGGSSDSASLRQGMGALL